MVEVRFFAGAADAAGHPSTRLEVADGTSGGEVLAAVAAGNGRLTPVLGVCTLPLAGRAHGDRATPLDGGEHTIDVLPPFAGG